MMNGLEIVRAKARRKDRMQIENLVGFRPTKTLMSCQTELIFISLVLRKFNLDCEVSIFAKDGI
jgi:hypothetical protein